MGSPPTKGRETNRVSPQAGLDSPLPSITERLANLRPSGELLEFYRQKMAQFDGEHEDLLLLLDKHRSTAEEQHKLQWEVRLREEEVMKLQAALEDMQAYLFQEREQALRLYAENNHLKIRELEDRTKIQHLLSLVGPDPDESTYLQREPAHKVIVPQKKVTMKSQQDSKTSKPAAKSSGDPRRSRDGEKERQTLQLQVEALRAQLEEQTRLARDQVEALQEDRRVQQAERRVQQQREMERSSVFSDKLQRTQTLLYESTRDLLQLRLESGAAEKQWMMERERLLQELDCCHQRLRAKQDVHRTTSPDPVKKLPALQAELKRTQKLADMYRDQCVQLETQLSQIREEGDAGRQIFQERSSKMASRLQVMTHRYEALEKRRALEVEGFKTDIQNLRQKVKDVEKLLLKLTLNTSPEPMMIQEVPQSNRRTRRVQDELKTLKAKILKLESEKNGCRKPTRVKR